MTGPGNAGETSPRVPRRTARVWLHRRAGHSKTALQPVRGSGGGAVFVFRTGQASVAKLRRIDARLATARLERVAMPAPDLARGTARQRGYDGRWDRTSRAFLAAHPLCLGCQAAGWTPSPSEVTDHTVPHKGDRALFWDAGNRQPSCRWHHDAVKAVLENLWARGLIGPEQLRLDSAEAVRLSRTLDTRRR